MREVDAPVLLVRIQVFDLERSRSHGGCDSLENLPVPILSQVLSAPNRGLNEHPIPATVHCQSPHFFDGAIFVLNHEIKRSVPGEAIDHPALSEFGELSIAGARAGVKLGDRGKDGTCSAPCNRGRAAVGEEG